MKPTGNLFEMELDPKKGRPQIMAVGHHAGLVVTRMVSIDYATSHGIWLYCGEGGAVIMILSGEAGILVRGECAPYILNAGEYLEISPSKGYRVEWTHPSTPTVWLTIGRRQFAELTEQDMEHAEMCTDDALLHHMSAEDLLYLHMTCATIAECK